MPKVSVVIPIYDMENGAFFLWRAINSVLDQTFKDVEIVITKDGKMAENTNSGIKKAKGELVKILYMDDWLDDIEYLEKVVRTFESERVEWVITGSTTNLTPYWTDDIETGNNKLGSPSALTFRNHFEDNLLFDEKLSWLLDCDLYRRMFDKYKSVHIQPKTLVGIGIHPGQMTNLMSDDYKLSEHKYMRSKYE